MQLPLTVLHFEVQISVSRFLSIFCVHFLVYYLCEKYYKPPAWRTSLNSSCRATLLLRNSLSFCSVSEKYFTFVLKIVMLGIEFYDGSFIFQCFRDVTPLPFCWHCFCWEIYCYSYFCLSLCLMCLFLSGCFKIFFLHHFFFFFFEFDYDMSLCIYVSCVWIFLSFLNLQAYNFYKIQTFGGPLLLQILFCPYYMHARLLEAVP